MYPIKNLKARRSETKHELVRYTTPRALRKKNRRGGSTSPQLSPEATPDNSKSMTLANGELADAAIMIALENGT